jgi:hypothetical protein
VCMSTSEDTEGDERRRTWSLIRNAHWTNLEAVTRLMSGPAGIEGNKPKPCRR